MATWDEIRDEIAGMLADGKPLEDVISKLDEMNKQKPMTNEQWLKQANTEQLAKWLSNHNAFIYECGQKQNMPKVMYEEDWEWWLKQPHK